MLFASWPVSGLPYISQVTSPCLFAGFFAFLRVWSDFSAAVWASAVRACKVGDRRSGRICAFQQQLDLLEDWGAGGGMSSSMEYVTAGRFERGNYGRESASPPLSACSESFVKRCLRHLSGKSHVQQDREDSRVRYGFSQIRRQHLDARSPLTRFNRFARRNSGPTYAHKATRRGRSGYYNKG